MWSVTDMVVNHYLYPGCQCDMCTAKIPFKAPEGKSIYMVCNEIPCMYYKNPTANKVCVYLHGNATCLSDLHASGFPAMLSRTTNSHVITVEYPGYGICCNRAMDRDDACCRNVERVLNYIRRKGASDVVLVGRSLGCGILLKTMAQNPRLNSLVKQVTLISAFSSVKDMCTNDFTRWIINDRLANKRNITALGPDVKVTIVHGVDDGLVPYEHAKVLSQSRAGSSLVPVHNMGHVMSPNVMVHVATVIANHLDGIASTLPNWDADVQEFAAQPEGVAPQTASARRSICPF